MAQQTSKPLLDAARGKKPAHTPLWLMRQAGRYLPEYREIRVKHDTLTMFKTPKIASEVTLQPLRRFPLDGAILYADILLIPDALGCGLSFAAGEGPKFARTIRSDEDLSWLKKQGEDIGAIVKKLSYVGETLSLVKPNLPASTTLIGFAGAPFTVASYLVEGGSAHGEFIQTKKLMFSAPHVLHGLLDILTNITIDYLKMQVEHGIEILQLFESWGGMLTPDQYAEFCAPYADRVLKALSGYVPTIHFVGESAGILPEALSVKSNVFSVDWRQDIARVSKVTTERVLQGNLDPLTLFADKKTLETKVRAILEKGRAHPGGYIFNLGHGIHRETPIENVEFLVKLVHS